MAKVSHPNVIPVYEIGELGDSTFIVMEFVEGQTLRAWEQTPRTQAEILAIYMAAARGLIAAHHEQLVHPAMALAERRDRVLILGGGDGMALREVLGYPETRSVTPSWIDAPGSKIW